jgi:L-aspartate oxidase
MLATSHPGPWAPRYLVGFDLRRRPHLGTDVLVIGGGVAGLSAALAAAGTGKEVLVLVKETLLDSNTAYAQGGVAAVLAEGERETGDAVERHVHDTLEAGAGLCDEAAVRDILGAAEAAIGFLRQQGCVFDRVDGRLALTREGGHCVRRILHANGDGTGREVARSLAAAVRANPLITVVENAFVLDLITEDDRVQGALYHRREELVAALASSTVLATGGCGRVWRETTNPVVATGDGLAMAYRAGAPLGDVEFMQFHPTTLYIAGGARILISEAMRGEGAILKNNAGERFMPKYHPDADLAPRDVVTRAIMAEVQKGDCPHVWLDATHLGAAFVTERFPIIAEACAKFGIDIASQWIPVHPSAHYHCGGVLSDAAGATTLDGLWVAGEVACTGLHGANRLASNSILEGLVMGLRAGRAAATAGGALGRVRLAVPKPAPVAEALDITDLADSLRALMWRRVGIERAGADLAYARRSLAFWLSHQARGEFRQREGWELQNLLTVGSVVATAAELRTASVGTHARTDSQGEIDRRRLVLMRPPSDG